MQEEVNTRFILSSIVTIGMNSNSKDRIYFDNGRLILREGVDGDLIIEDEFEIHAVVTKEDAAKIAEAIQSYLREAN